MARISPFCYNDAASRGSRQKKEAYAMHILEVTDLKKTYATRFGANAVEALRSE